MFYDSIIELSSNAGFLKEGKIDERSLLNASIDKIVMFCEQLAEITDYKNINIAPTIYNHAASTALGGGKSPCSNIECRLNRINEMSQFACLYSDHVFISNFTYLLPSSIALGSSEEEIKIQFAHDFLLIARILPLIKANKVTLVTYRNICPHCLAIKAISESNKSDYKAACKKLEETYYAEASFFVGKNSSGYFYGAKGTEKLFAHEGISYACNLDRLEKVCGNVSKKLEKTNLKPITINQARKMKIGEQIAFETINSCSFELGSSRFMGSSYLTESEIEVEFIQSLTTDPIAHRRSVLMHKYLNCLVPFIDEIDPIKLLKLREMEGDAFILFRQSLIKAVEEYKSADENLTERDAQAIYGDIIQPRLSSLETKVKSAKKLKLRKALAWTGAISVGIYTGTLTSSIFAGTATVAGVKMGAEFIENTLGGACMNEAIQNDDMYFLWKVKKLVR